MYSLQTQNETLDRRRREAHPLTAYNSQSPSGPPCSLGWSAALVLPSFLTDPDLPPFALTAR
jgi:hypothetical protein